MGLQQLYIENFAIIESLEVEFSDGLNIITGETGAGKSIIIDALSLALGEKASPAMIRSGADCAVTICTFRLDPLRSPLHEYLAASELRIDGDELVLKREVQSNGRSKAWINDRPCTVTTLKEIGDLLVDLHGQHDHQSLLREENHLGFLDAFGDYRELLAQLGDLYGQISNLDDRLTQMRRQQQVQKEKAELWQFQLQDIDKVKPQPGEYEKLLQEKTILENAEKIHQLAGGLVQSLYEGDNTLYNRILDVVQQLHQLQSFDKALAEYDTRLNEMRYLIQELAGYLSRYSDRVQFDPQRLETVNSRLFALQQLLKKYGPTTDEVLAYRAKMMSELDAGDSIAEEIARLAAELQQLQQRFTDQAQQLSHRRRDTAAALTAAMDRVLPELGINGAQFRVNLTWLRNPAGWVRIGNERYGAHPGGIDQVIFEISTNPGEPLRPLAQIVSGGEVSRIMLGLKSISAGRDGIPVLIFDEIDTGISGRIAHIVGEKLAELARRHQVFCITHLPQIAGLGAAHYRVEKSQTDQRSTTRMFRLTVDQRIEELAQLIGGRQITATSRQQARELLAFP